MLDFVLAKKSLAVKMSVKATVSVLLVVMAVALPQITHAIGGVQAGSIWMPMYMPALLAGILLGWQWGLGVGILSPVVSFGFTSLALGSAMPNLQRLPYMILEIGAYGGISGLFSRQVQKTPALAFPVVLGAQVSGRAIYLVYNLMAGRDFALIWSSIQTSTVGVYAQAILVPVIAIILCMVLKHEQKTE